MSGELREPQERAVCGDAPADDRRRGGGRGSLPGKLSQLKRVYICTETLKKATLLAVLFEVLFRLIFP